jgi:hypothetical protein
MLGRAGNAVAVKKGPDCGAFARDTPVGE